MKKTLWLAGAMLLLLTGSFAAQTAKDVWPPRVTVKFKLDSGLDHLVSLLGKLSGTTEAQHLGEVTKAMTNELNQLFGFLQFAAYTGAGDPTEGYVLLITLKPQKADAARAGTPNVIQTAEYELKILSGSIELHREVLEFSEGDEITSLVNPSTAQEQYIKRFARNLELRKSYLMHEFFSEIDLAREAVPQRLGIGVYFHSKSPRIFLPFFLADFLALSPGPGTPLGFLMRYKTFDEDDEPVVRWIRAKALSRDDLVEEVELYDGVVEYGSRKGLNASYFDAAGGRAWNTRIVCEPVEPDEGATEAARKELSSLGELAADEGLEEGAKGMRELRFDQFSVFDYEIDVMLKPRKPSEVMEDLRRNHFRVES